MEFKWLLFLPVYRFAYIGMIANAYAKEQNMQGVNYSLYEVILSSIFSLSACLLVRHQTDIILVTTCGAALMWGVVRVAESFTILRLFNKHPIIFACLCLVPGILLYKASEALRVLLHDMEISNRRLGNFNCVQGKEVCNE